MNTCISIHPYTLHIHPSINMHTSMHPSARIHPCIRSSRILNNKHCRESAFVKYFQSDRQASRHKPANRQTEKLIVRFNYREIGGMAQLILYQLCLSRCISTHVSETESVLVFRVQWHLQSVCRARSL